MTTNEKYVVGLGEALWDILPDGKNWVALLPTSLSTPDSSASTPSP